MEFREDNNETGMKTGEQVFHGIGASKGIAVGPAFLFMKSVVEESNEVLDSDSIEQEIERFLGALQRSEKELTKIEQVTTRKLGKVYSDLFNAQIMLLHDRMLIDSVCNRIRQEHKTAGTVIEEEFDKYLQHFNNSSDQLFQERAQDLIDIKNRILRNLQNKKLQSRIPEGMIVVSTCLSPADIILFSRTSVRAFVTETGGVTSHISLICRSLNIPIIVGISNFTQKLKTGDQLIVDGTSGTAILSPADRTIDEYLRRHEEESRVEADVCRLADAPSQTRCGTPLHFYSNIDFKEEIPSVRNAGAEGVGLFRSENLFIDNTKPPQEAEQQAYYSDMAEALAPDPLVIRLFDIGGDKLIYSSIREPNPNLGWRGIRILIDVPDILDSQLLAILKANTRRNIQVLMPMISSIEEITQIRTTLERHVLALRESGTTCDMPKIGAMIEIPAAVLLIDEITKMVDFISIGTNDLTQYTLAVDRNNEIVQDLFDKFHPAIIRQLHTIITTANRNSCKVSLCGDMGSDPLALPFLLGCGLREFSIVSADIAQLKSIARYLTVDSSRQLAEACLTLDSAAKIKERLKEYQAQHVPDSLPGIDRNA
ncbi:phosphoenolpyruvate--protein phosphotransferase [Prosthecochloris sp. N3]|uniref:Phosphoenolpyruvate-protein phosphotransferase n=1 Tax=Prosthecochloris ethylica TaxID=2743976 RepID=A0ABR9XS76_9CHLB|nr:MULTISPECIES: phosphoenolpyruvate--protein phosphotransferase [Prosthecochloris]MBF0586900.1 phosphoenolpyruvate--protein phosphotransferase [Prosthecochloris ethylica]MBF0636752.1 phosphoenolpyruvate--protein phosphotransferase [Prosthecochloris ethylica]NUK48429.1 phosphoenolpyruvate--protein phosphotransferase [Prosthecochloris ethylica]RNA64266.1 phosphoenolpyruvate--protein phosphotransferase [Prosthecochloris sp. ZM_2]